MTKNIVENGGFELDSNGDGIPDGWNFRHVAGNGSIALDNHVAHSGTRSVTINGGGAEITAVESPAFAVKPGEIYRLSFWYKTRDVKRNPSVCPTGSLFGVVAHIRFMDKDSKAYGLDWLYERFAQGLSAINDWTELSREFFIPVGVPCLLEQCVVRIGLWRAEGIMWVDDVKLHQAGIKENYLNPPPVNYPPSLSISFAQSAWPHMQKKGVLVQLWPWKTKYPAGNPSVEIITAREKWIPELKQKYGVETLVLEPMEHNDCGTGFVSDNELKSAIADYQRNGIKVILYTSLMHVGHDLSWHRVTKEHPEWILRDQFGNPENFYEDSYLCYNTGAFDFCLNYTIEMIRKLNPDGIMLDNQWRWNLCYCDGCQAKFKRDLLSRFNNHELEACFGVSRQAVEQLAMHDGVDARLFREWVDYSIYSCAEAIERVRKALRAIKPDILVTANITPIFTRPGVVQPTDAQDIILYESPLQRSTKAISERLLISRAMAQGNPFYNYEYTWKWDGTPGQLKGILPPRQLQQLIALTLAHNAIPHIPPYGFDSLVNPRGISREGLQALSAYLTFFRDHKELFLSTGLYANVAVFIPETPFQGREGIFQSLLDQHVPFEVIRDATSDALSKYRLLCFIDNRCLSDAQITVVRDYVAHGGILLFTGKTAAYTEMAEVRKVPGFFSAFGMETNAERRRIDYGQGRVIYVPDESGLTVILREERQNSPVKVEASSDVEIIPWYSSEKGPSEIKRLTIHYLNHNLQQSAGDIQTCLRLPAALDVRTLTWYSPDNQSAGQKCAYRLTREQDQIRLEYSLPDKLDIYGIVKVEFQK